MDRDKTVIRVRGLSKRYMVRKHGGIFVRRESFWALKDVSFDVGEGEIVGIVGKNAAGKSTLLKILSRVTHPTKGRAVIRGEVCALLSSGIGFNQEFTGRENIYLNGTILGMRKRDIDRLFEEVLEFSGIGKFVDTPVKRYSRGMKSRLAFSISTILEQEVLLIDEVLSAGDIGFREKCIEKMREISVQGKTILVASHNTRVLQSLADRCIYLKRGLLVDDGPANEILEKYEADLKKGRKHRIA